MFVLVGGPSKAGKSTLVDSLCERFPDRFKRPLSYTTRDRRTDRADEYFEFVSDEEFDALVNGNALLQEDRARGHRYGISAQSFDEIVTAGKHPIHEISHDNQERFELERSDLFRIAVRRSVADTDPEWPHMSDVCSRYHIEVSMDGDVEAAADTVVAKLEAHGAWPAGGPDVREVDATNAHGYSALAAEFDERRVTTNDFHALTTGFWRRALSDISSGSSVVELGPGRGWLMGNARSRHFDYVGLESAAEMVGSAQDVRFVPSLRNIDVPSHSVDVVVGSLVEGVMYPLALAEVRRILRPGGKLHVTMPSAVWAHALREPDNLDQTTFVQASGQEVAVFSFAHTPETMVTYLGAAGFRLTRHVAMSGRSQSTAVSAPAITTAADRLGIAADRLDVIDGYVAEAI